VDTKNEPNFYIFLEDVFILFKSFTGSLDNFVCRKHCIDSISVYSNILVYFMTDFYIFVIFSTFF